MCAHDGADEIRVVVARSGVVLGVAGLEGGGGCSDCRGSHDGDERGDELHVVLLVLFL